MENSLTQRSLKNLRLLSRRSRAMECSWAGPGRRRQRWQAAHPGAPAHLLVRVAQAVEGAQHLPPAAGFAQADRELQCQLLQVEGVV